MPWTTPETFTAGQTLTAASMNAISENTRVLRALANVQQGVEDAASSQSVATATWSTDIVTCSITPTAATSNVFIRAMVTFGTEAGVAVFGGLFRGGSIIDAATGEAASSRVRVTGGAIGVPDQAINTMSLAFVDSPATTSALTYSVRIRHWSSITRTLYINRSVTDTNSALFPRAICTLIAQEIPA